jgi:uncharacterized membrane protein YedE/YeeE
MWDVLPAQLPWWVAGPAVGLCVVAMYGLANRKLGVSGGWLQLLLVASRRPTTESWRLVFNGGLVVGALLAASLGTGASAAHYGALGAALPVYALVPLLVVVGGLIGYGARWAGGCTSGHGISGCSVGSPESLTATAVFFSVAVAVTLAVHALSGGAV